MNLRKHFHLLALRVSLSQCFKLNGWFNYEPQRSRLIYAIFSSFTTSHLIINYRSLIITTYLRMYQNACRGDFYGILFAIMLTNYFLFCRFLVSFLWSGVIKLTMENIIWVLPMNTISKDKCYWLSFHLY